MTPTEEVARMEGRVEMIDYCLDMFCTAELTNPARIHLKRIKFDLIRKIDGCKCNREVENKD